ncbi:MAG: ornithine carbamoyltransferase [Propionibacteriaceae bacterium]|nr:ornithine carbamoyltransferase [Propionibacteriaceae bacterium]
MDVTSALRGRSFLKELDFTTAEWLGLIDLAADLKAERRTLGVDQPQRLRGQSIALIFEKTSTRTRCAFEVAAHEQGAHTTYLDSQGSQMGHKESVADTARVLGRMFDGIEYRGFGQDRVEELAAKAGVPVFNGLTDEWHPTQMLADQLTMREHSGRPLDQLKLAYIGDARSNVGNSLLVSSAMVGMDIAIVAPTSLQPAADVVDAAKARAEQTGSSIMLSDDLDAVAGADFVYTDIWISMGESADLYAQRVNLLSPYRVDAALLARTGNPDVKVLHDLPALHDMGTKMARQLAEMTGTTQFEITDAVFEANANVIFDEAENRMHTIKAVLVAALAT